MFNFSHTVHFLTVLQIKFCMFYDKIDNVTVLKLGKKSIIS